MLISLTSFPKPLFDEFWRTVLAELVRDGPIRVASGGPVLRNPKRPELRSLQALEKSDARAKFGSPWGSGRTYVKFCPHLTTVSLQTATKETIKISL
jgi:hypothetical protein